MIEPGVAGRERAGDLLINTRGPHHPRDRQDQLRGAAVQVDPVETVVVGRRRQRRGIGVVGVKWCSGPVVSLRDRSLPDAPGWDNRVVISRSHDTCWTSGVCPEHRRSRSEGLDDEFVDDDRKA